MSELNKFSLYSLSYKGYQNTKKDHIDRHIEFLKLEDDYEKVQSYLVEHFGDFSNGKWFEFEDIHKSCYLLAQDEKIEFCAQKNHRDYFGKGWLKTKNNS